YPKADRSLSSSEVLGSFITQFYDDKPCPRLILVSEDVAECDLLADASTTNSRHKLDVSWPRPGDRKGQVDDAPSTARHALARRAQGSGRSRACQCARGAGAQAGGDILATETADCDGGNIWTTCTAAPHRGL